jgi:dihydroflavonol-4-reductase
VRPSSGKLILEVAKRKAPGKTTGFNSFVDVRDVARGMVLAWQKGKTGERYILAGENLTWGEVMELVAKVAGVRPPRFYIPRLLSFPVGWVGDVQGLLGKEPLINSMALRHAYGTRFRFSSAKAERELGWTRGPLEVAIADALAWFRGAGML